MIAELHRPENAAAIVLAAGRSMRMGSQNKLLMEIEPGLAVVRRVVESAVASGIERVHVVTGHEAERVRVTLGGLPCGFVHNASFADGLSGSVKAGFRQAVGEGAPGVLVLLGDMPFIPAQAIAAVLDAAALNPGRIIQAVSAGKPAHPVWLPARLAATVDGLDGDRGVRNLILETDERMITVEVGDDAAFDLDTLDDFAVAMNRKA